MAYSCGGVDGRDLASGRGLPYFPLSLLLSSYPSSTLRPPRRLMSFVLFLWRKGANEAQPLSIFSFLLFLV